MLYAPGLSMSARYRPSRAAEARIRQTLRRAYMHAMRSGRFYARLTDDYPYSELARSQPAAVLVPLLAYPNEYRLLLTRRAAHLPRHPGQIAFPGGRVESGDVTPAQAALRETEEEVGLDRERVRLLGPLPDLLTVTGYRVSAVVGVIREPPPLRLDQREVAEAFELPLPYVMERTHFVVRARTVRGRRVESRVLPYRHYNIWGATARLLWRLHECLAGDG